MQVLENVDISRMKVRDHQEILKKKKKKQMSRYKEENKVELEHMKT